MSYSKPCWRVLGVDTLATALYVKTDDLLKTSPQHAPWRPKVGIAREFPMPGCWPWQ